MSYPESRRFPMRRWLALSGLLAVLAASFSFAPSEAADKAPATDWPEYRGPNRDDCSPDTGLLKQWPKDGPPLFWKEPAKGSGRWIFDRVRGG